MTASPTAFSAAQYVADSGQRMTQQLVREEVAAFRRQGAYGSSEADCFPAWYLHHRHRVAASDAIAQTADGADGVRRNYDFGLDAFHILREGGEPPTLLLIQAKFTDDIAAVSAALRDLQRALPRVAEALTVAPSTATRENRVLVCLRDRLREVSDEERASLRLRFEVLHLSEADDLFVRANTRRPYDDLREALSRDDVLERWRYDIALVGPAAMGGVIPPPPLPPQIWHDVVLDAVPLMVPVGERDVTMYSGVGRLSDLVGLYNRRRSDLFAKNVRYFLANKQNEARGPSGKIKETLQYMCIPKRGSFAVEPELFALHHNGVTIFARDVQKDADGRIVRVRDPYVLNGCQTVRSAYDFRYDAKSAGKIDSDRWQRVVLPVRIITTQQEDLIRQITISNNRQNQISPSALRANDDVQLELEQRLKDHGVFYERQKGALDELIRSNSARIREYPHTNNRSVRIDDLARCLAAVAGDFDLAHSPSHIFEYDPSYERVFAPERLGSTTLVVLLQNLHDVLPVILKNDLGLEPTNHRAPRKSRLVYFTLCLLARQLAKNQMDDWVGMYGSELLGKEQGFRNAVAYQLGNHRSHIKQALKDYFLCLEETNADTLREAFRKAAWSFNLRDTIDVFRVLGGIDLRLSQG